MNGSTKIKFTEAQKSVTTEVVVEHEDGKEAMKLAKQLFQEAMEYSKIKTLQKNV